MLVMRDRSPWLLFIFLPYWPMIELLPNKSGPDLIR
jgi:hypothetical protein